MTLTTFMLIALILLAVLITAGSTYAWIHIKRRKVGAFATSITISIVASILMIKLADYSWHGEISQHEYREVYKMMNLDDMEMKQDILKCLDDEKITPAEYNDLINKYGHKRKIDEDYKRKVLYKKFVMTV